MNKNILKLSIILMLVYSFTLPSFVYADQLPPYVFEFGTQFIQLFSIILLFLTVTLGAFLKFLKVRFSAIKHKKSALLGIAVLLVALSFFDAYLWDRGSGFFIFFSLLLLFLIITFVLFLKILDVQFSSGEYVKNILLSIVSLVMSVFFMVFYISFMSFFNFRSLLFALLSYIIFLVFAGLFIKFFKARLCAIKYKKYISFVIIILLGIMSIIMTYLLDISVGLII